MLVELLACEVYSSVGDDHVRWSDIDIYPVKAQSILGGFSGNILELLSCLELSGFVDNMEKWLVVDIHDVNHDGVVKVNFFTEIELEAG